MLGKVVLITSVSQRLGQMAAQALSHSGHVVFCAVEEADQDCTIRDQLRAYAKEYGVDIRPIDLDASHEAGPSRAIDDIIKKAGRLDAVVHTRHIAAFGPAEAFSDGQLAAAFDTLVLSAQRINQAAVPYMRRSLSGLLVWIISSGAVGGTLPFRSLQLVASSALDALAVQYSQELAPWGIESTLVVAGSHMDAASDPSRLVKSAYDIRAAEYDSGVFSGTLDAVSDASARLTGKNPDIGRIAGAIVEAVDTPYGYRPFRIHVDPASDGAEVAYAVVDRLRTEILYRTRLDHFILPAQRHAGGKDHSHC